MITKEEAIYKLSKSRCRDEKFIYVNHLKRMGFFDKESVIVNNIHTFVGPYVCLQPKITLNESESYFRDFSEKKFDVILPTNPTSSSSAFFFFFKYNSESLSYKEFSFDSMNDIVLKDVLPTQRFMFIKIAYNKERFLWEHI